MLRFRYTTVQLRHPAATLGGATVRRLPLLQVGVTGPGGHLIRRFRVDSGADDTILPLAFAAQLGVDLANAPLAEAESASGTIVRYPCARVTLRISDGVEHCEWDAVIGFVNVTRQMGLAGLAGFLDYFDTDLFGHAKEFTLDPNADFLGEHGRHPDV